MMQGDREYTAGGRGSLDIGGSIATYYRAAIAASNLSLSEWLSRGPLLIMVSPLIQIEIGLPLSWNAPRGPLISSAGQERTGASLVLMRRGRDELIANIAADRGAKPLSHRSRNMSTLR